MKTNFDQITNIDNTKTNYGAIYSTEDYSIQLDSLTFKQNIIKNTSQGGIIYIESFRDNIYINSCSFIQNQSKSGVLYFFKQFIPQPMGLRIL